MLLTCQWALGSTPQKKMFPLPLELEREELKISIFVQLLPQWL